MVVLRPRGVGVFSSPVESPFRTSDPLPYSDDDGLPDYPRPPGEAPTLPEDLTDLDDVAIINLLTELTRWHDYAMTRLARASAADKRADMELGYAKAQVFVANWTGGRDEKVTVTQMLRDSSAEVKDAQEKSLIAYQARKRLEVRTQALADDAFIVSRELTRRTHMEPPVRRESRWGGS